MEHLIPDLRDDQGETISHQYWDKGILLLSGFKRMLRTGVNTGMWHLNDVFFIDHRGNVCVQKTILSMQRKKDPITNATYSRAIKYYCGGYETQYWRDFAHRFRDYIIDDMNSTGAMIDTIQFGRFLRLTNAAYGSEGSPFSYGIEGWDDDMYECIVYSDDRAQRCPICVGHLTGIQSESNLWTETYYDLGGRMDGLVIPYPRKLANLSHKMKKCIWYRGDNAHTDQDPQDLLPKDTNTDVYTYHFKMQHNHLHYHKLSVSQSHRVLIQSTGESVNTLDLGIMDTVLLTYKGIIIDSLIKTAKEVKFSDTLYWSCSDILHEIPLPIDRTWRNASKIGRKYLLVLMALVHNGSLIRGVFNRRKECAKMSIGERGRPIQEIEAMKLWTIIAEESEKFMLLSYCGWLGDCAKSGKVPVSVSMVQIDWKFNGKYQLPPWVLLTDSMIKLKKVDDLTFITAERYRTLIEIREDQLSDEFLSNYKPDGRIAFYDTGAINFDRDMIYTVDVMNADSSPSFKIFCTFRGVLVNRSIDGCMELGNLNGIYLHLFSLIH